MGEVYRARDSRLGRAVALKILPAECAFNPDRRRRFEQESRIASALSHPNIVTVYDVGDQDGVSYIVSELVEANPSATSPTAVRFPSGKPSTSAPRSPKAWPPPTRRASSIATSNPKTSCSVPLTIGIGRDERSARMRSVP